MIIDNPYLLYNNSILYRLYNISFYDFQNINNEYFAVSEEFLPIYNNDIERQYTIFNDIVDAYGYISDLDKTHDKYYNLRISLLVITYDRDYLVNIKNILYSKIY